MASSIENSADPRTDTFLLAADDHAGDPSAPPVLGQGQGEPDINEAQNPFPSNTGASRSSLSVDSEDGFREPARLANGDAAQDAIQ